MSFVRNPLTGRSIRVGGATYTKLVQSPAFGFASPQPVPIAAHPRPQIRQGGTGRRGIGFGAASPSWPVASAPWHYGHARAASKTVARTGGALMVDLERRRARTAQLRRRGAKLVHAIRVRWTEAAKRRQRRIVAMGETARSETVRKGARRSLKGKYLTRPSPPVSATQFSADEPPHVGNDGNLWRIVINRSGIHRWQRV